MKQQVYQLLEPNEEAGLSGKLVELGLIGLVLANVLAVVLETVPDIGPPNAVFFERLEDVSLVVFTLEYVLRLWSCTHLSEYQHPVLGRLRFALHPMILVDLLAISPLFLYGLDFDMRALRALRMIRLLRLLKLARYFEGLSVLGRVMREKGPELLSMLFVMFLVLVVASTFMYRLESGVNPAFSSIPAAMWWGVATLTTIGYGDIVPVTPGGKIFGAFIAVLGIGMFAIPAGLLGSAFAHELNERRDARRRQQEQQRPGHGPRPS